MQYIILYENMSYNRRQFIVIRKHTDNDIVAIT